MRPRCAYNLGLRAGGGRFLPVDRICPKQFAHYERRLPKLNNTDVQHVVWGALHTPPLRRAKPPNAAQHGTAGGAFEAVPLPVHAREIPEWAHSDEKVRRFIAHRFPAAFAVKPDGHKKWTRWFIAKVRRRAAQLASIIYLVFRCLWHFASVWRSI